VADPIITRKRLRYPPKVNSVTAKQKIVLSNNEVTFLDFTRYNLYQLPGQIEFINSNDVGETILFSYLADKKTTIEKNKDQTPNYKFEGFNAAGKGVFTLYGRFFLSTRAQIFIRYKTTIDRCPKCAGTGYLNDINFDSRGRIQLVYDFSKLIQDFFKRMNTQKGSNSFDVSEGTDIPNTIGLAGADRELAETLIKTEIVNLLFSIRDKQKLQRNVQGIGLAEQIERINSIEVRSINATDMTVAIEVVSKSGRIEQLSSTVSI